MATVKGQLKRLLSAREVLEKNNKEGPRANYKEQSRSDSSKEQTRINGNLERTNYKGKPQQT